MIPELKKFIVLAVATIVFLGAATASSSLTWRTNPPQQIVVAAR